ncbi:hypothetical protein FA15DRAFT_504022 [Coprinopsis marcescibilis]|uniref:Uncharacterized protein n=1 Tax=Coprinopsis marcescibilis TaxID=230819 RepID=A0A5C3KSA4_COPMA|nr:hypothetical protein FA15DRAFT_504022 [Coprinopsis marcescibilis]
MERQMAWQDTPFSMFAAQTFDPPRQPDVMQALLEHSVSNYVPLPYELCRMGFRKDSRPLPYRQQPTPNSNPRIEPSGTVPNPPVYPSITTSGGAPPSTAKTNTPIDASAAAVQASREANGEANDTIVPKRSLPPSTTLLLRLHLRISANAESLITTSTHQPSQPSRGARVALPPFLYVEAGARVVGNGLPLLVRTRG